MKHDVTVIRNAELIETEVDGDMVALDVERGTCFGFNATASRVWALIEQPRPVSEIVARLGVEFDVEPDACEHDVMILVRTLEQQGLVRTEPATG